MSAMRTHIRRLRQRVAIADALMNLRLAPIATLPAADPTGLDLKQGLQKNR
jgi:hypothetical protein